MKEWFLSREPRERVILAVGAAVAGVIVLFGFIWRPLAAGTAELRESVEEKNRLLIDLQQAAAVPDTARPARSAPGQSLVVLVDSTAQAHGVAEALTRRRPDGPDRIDVTFENASFDALVSWLVALQTEHGIGVEAASVTSGSGPGLVNGQIFLRRS
ncbi:MAG TPA: type II secretion system protein M [Gammaproteobacteria bacterium]